MCISWTNFRTQRGYQSGWPAKPIELQPDSQACSRPTLLKAVRAALPLKKIGWLSKLSGMAGLTKTVGGEANRSNVMETDVVEGRVMAWRSNTETWGCGIKFRTHAGTLCMSAKASWTCRSNVVDHVFPFPIHSSGLNDSQVLLISSVENTSTILVSSWNGLWSLPLPVRRTGINGLFMWARNGVDVNAGAECKWLENVFMQPRELKGCKIGFVLVSA